MQLKAELSTLTLAILLMGIIIIMILPVPSWALDFGLAASFSLAILMFTTTLFIQRPLDFSAFPIILIGSLILRLSLNVASTKLIIDEGNTGTGAAGRVIESFALFIMGENIALGLVIFCILLIVNFLVINKGATRMAEVGARFALDAMPGKQLAIDSDLASGAITHSEAKKRREEEQAETTFFGSLDGASKFVKGDAVAGLLITILNLFAGVAVGFIMHGMTFSDALSTYSILTVGDGLVSQIPAVLISVATALLLARGGASGATDKEVTYQLGKHPTALIVVAILLVVFALLPGLPFIPFFLAAMLFSACALNIFSKNKSTTKIEPENIEAETNHAPKQSLASILEHDDIHIEFANDLTSMALDRHSGLDMRIANIRRHIAVEYGVLLPDIRLTDNHALTNGEYIIKLLGVAHGRYTLKPDHLLALTQNARAQRLEGDLVCEPVFNAPAVWIKPEAAEAAMLDGLTVVQPAEILATHLLEVLKQNFPKIFSLSALQNRLLEMTQLDDATKAASNKRFLDNLIPDKVPLELLHATLKSLLSDQISIRNLHLIIESIAEGRQLSQGWETIYEHVRSRLGFQIMEKLLDENKELNVIQLAQEWEGIFLNHQTKAEIGHQANISLPPNILQDLITKVTSEIGRTPSDQSLITIISSSKRRRFIRSILSAKGFNNPVISYEEVDPNVKLKLVGVIEA